MNGVTQKQDVLYRLGMVHPLVLEEPGHIVGDTSTRLSHVPFVFWLGAVLRPRLFVEVGTHAGVSSSAFCRADSSFGQSARAFAVDAKPGDEHAGPSSAMVFRELNSYNERRHAVVSEQVRCTFDEAVDRFEDGSIDLLHIDGRHTYEAVRHDFEAWRPKLRSDAVVLFPHTQVRERGFGVWRLFDELRLHHASFKFVHGHGLGVLAMGNTVPAALEGLLMPPGQVLEPSIDAAVQSYFATIGTNRARFRPAWLRISKGLGLRLEAARRVAPRLREPGPSVRDGRPQFEVVTRLSGGPATQRRPNAEGPAFLVGRGEG